MGIFDHLFPEDDAVWKAYQEQRRKPLELPPVDVGGGARAATSSSQLLQPTGPDGLFMSNYSPSTGERISQGLSGMLQSAGLSPSLAHHYGDTAESTWGLTPMAAAEDAGYQLGAGNKVGGLMSAMGAVPDVGKLAPAMFIGMGNKLTKQHEWLALIDDLQKGMSEEDAWRVHGWREEPFSGSPMGEISDVPMKLHKDPLKQLMKGNNVQGRLGDILHHPELFEAYPHLKDVQVDLKMGSFGGSYDAASNKIEGKAPFLYHPSDKPGGPMEHHNLHSLLAHEIQHAIQQFEGWPLGSNLAQGILHTPSTDAVKAQMKDFEKLRKAAYRTYLTSKDTGKSNAAFERWKEYGKNLDDLNRIHMHNTAFEYYRRNPGETQARNTERRLGLSVDERRNTPTEQTQDLPYSEQNRVYGPQGHIRNPKSEPAPKGLLGEVWQSGGRR